jgi:hypothetical protein
MSPGLPPQPRSAPGRCSRPDLAAHITRFDEVEPMVRRELDDHALTCPSCGPPLRLLKRAEAWLAGAGPAPRSCPTAAELFDYANAPGAKPMIEQLRRVVDLHLTQCANCRDEVTSLRRPPPLPLDLSPLPVETSAPSPARQARRPWLAAVVLAAAAGTLGLAGWRWFFPTHGGQGQAPSPASGAPTAQGPFPGGMESSKESPSEVASAAVAVRYPVPELLRADGAPALYFPRGRVLLDERNRPKFGLTFEIEPVERVQFYRFEIAPRPAEVFGNLGTPQRFESVEPIAHPPAEVLAALEPGSFTWTAWAVVDGLDRELGRRDFELVKSPELLAKLARTLSAEGPQSAEKTLVLLHLENWLSDARSFARTLPASPEREAYLRGWTQR